MNNIKAIFTIKDLENISGIKAHTIRIWEKRYNLLEPNRTETNIRYYSADCLHKLLNVVLLNKNSFKISKIAKMSDDEILTSSRQIADSNAIEDDAINTFKVAMFQFNQEMFNEAYSKVLQTKSFQEVFKEIFIPFLNQIGMMWQTKTILPAHEHFISNLIVQKIQINIEELPQNNSDKDHTYVLFLPEGEIHEIGLLYLNYELLLKGYKTIYLGHSLPLDNLKCFFNSKNNSSFITSLTVKPYDEEMEKYFIKVGEALEGSDHDFIAIGIRTTTVKELNFNNNIHLYPSILEYIDNIK